MTKHTPGPWTLLPDNNGWTLHANGRDITTEAFDCTDDDARLIAAAPDLLDALKLARRALEDNDIDEMMAGEFEIITDAIVKATGDA